MIRRRIGYAVWLMLTACLYFFENNTGTRVVFFGSLLFPLIPSLRTLFFSPDEAKSGNTAENMSVKSFVRLETEEPGDIRTYMPGDPIRRIHWKLSAKKNELLVREMTIEPEPMEEERITRFTVKKQKKASRKLPAAVCAAGIMICTGLLLLVPEANLGAKALCNRLFAASEAVNTYVYFYYSVSENQSVFLAAFLLTCIIAILFVLTVLFHSRLIMLGIAALCILAQVYFGLALPTWGNIALYGLLALWMMKRPADRKELWILCGYILAVSMAVIFILPGVDAATENASETIRDQLSHLTQQITGLLPEAAEGETETRHIHTRSMESGEREAKTEKEFRLVTVEEEQISMPHWVNWIKVILLLLLSAALVVLPFTPFILLNARRKKAQETRKIFVSEDAGEAVQAIFRQIIIWLEITNQGAGNLLYRDWKAQLTESLPEGYPDRFARCAADYEEAGYSNHPIPEQKRRDALNLLKETENALWKKADRKQRFLLKYWMCLCE